VIHNETVEQSRKKKEDNMKMKQKKDTFWFDVLLMSFSSVPHIRSTSGICRSINICCVWDQTPSGLFCHSPCLDQPMKLSWLGISCCGGWQLPFQQASAACSLVFWRKDECLSSRMPSADELTATGIEEWQEPLGKHCHFPTNVPFSGVSLVCHLYAWRQAHGRCYFHNHI